MKTLTFKTMLLCLAGFQITWKAIGVSANSLLLSFNKRERSLIAKITHFYYLNSRFGVHSTKYYGSIYRNVIGSCWKQISIQ